MYSLGQLIEDRMAVEGRSLAGVVAYAKQRGHLLSKSNLARLKDEPPKAITRSALYALAAGLGVTPLTVANAVLESWDIETRPVEITDSLATIGIDPSLSEQDKRRLAMLVTDMRIGSVDHSEKWPWGNRGDTDGASRQAAP